MLTNHPLVLLRLKSNKIELFEVLEVKVIVLMLCSSVQDKSGKNKQYETL